VLSRGTVFAGDLSDALVGCWWVTLLQAKRGGRLSGSSNGVGDLGQSFAWKKKGKARLELEQNWIRTSNVAKMTVTRDVAKQLAELEGYVGRRRVSWIDRECVQCVEMVQTAKEVKVRQRQEHSSLEVDQERVSLQQRRSRVSKNNTERLMRR